MNLFLQTQDVLPESVTIKIAGEIDISNINELIEEIERYDVETVKLNCSGLSFIDSTGIGYLLRKALELKKENRKLTLESIPELIHGVFEEMGIFEILDEMNERT